jgi:adenosylcobyric acid synthase
MHPMPAIMVVGTTSHAGKSLLNAVICRWLKRKGLRVTPFKGQNMALNAYVTSNGEEIGHAQAVQAWAAGIAPRVEMNPILLKPQGDMTSQVILRGKPVGKVRAADYYRDYFDRGWDAITESLATLQQDYDWIVCEGAGSPAEINLKHRDLTNMRVAKHLQATTLLVADIDRGGVFAHIVGTLQLLDPDERALIKGLIINKFRGQRSLLDSGITWLEEYTGIPVIGVIPWLPQAFSAEDSLSLFERHPASSTGELTIAVIRLPRIANFTDFEPLSAEPTVQLTYVELDQPLGQPDAVILPGTKTTLSDLDALHRSGMAEQIKAYADAGGMVMGICGGMQMMGETLVDPDGNEGEIPFGHGLGLFPLATRMGPEKVTQQRSLHAIDLPPFWAGLSRRDGLDAIVGYEIHQGQTEMIRTTGICPLWSDATLGYVAEDRPVMATYLHDVFNNGPWRRAWLNWLRARKSLPPLSVTVPNYDQERQRVLDEMTNAIAPHLDLEAVWPASA